MRHADVPPTTQGDDDVPHGSERQTERRRWRSRTALALTAAVGLTLGLGGCATDSGGPTDITFHMSKPEAIPYFRELAKKFNAEQSDVHVDLDTASNLSAGFLRGNPPDVGLLNYNEEMARFMERGALSDLSDLPVAERIRPDVQELVDQYATYPGRTSVLPYSVAAASVIYNVKLFEENGVEVPTTWDELIAACDTFEAAGITPIYSTYKEPWTVGQGLFDYTVGGSIDVADFYDRLDELGTEVGPDSEVSFEKTLKEPVERMVELAEYSNDNAASRSYGDGNVAMAKGEAAMYLQGPWALGEIAKTDPDVELGTFPLPMTDDPDDLKVRVNLDLALWVPEASTEKEAAKAFVSYLMEQDTLDEYNAEFLGFGTTVDAAPATDERIVGMQKYYDDGRFYQGASKFVPLSIPTDNYIQSIVTGADVDATLRRLDADWARLALRG
ncbi:MULTISPECIES: extracellular solute-binding protein [unclassified Leifsonia]|uniref:extracellular solute-binding protein n=1 Tax=unclassified Leifsonia TaxID=2663824 RepID=UPI00070030E1|nr:MULTISPECIES: extracellular solute-binding protein [unclassified Leifsonia]KQX08280.1 carbohydrate-binding protein [Leifsonia sp. Root1293]KRA12562.1 carbohydrate-binding protein [Leifsonia sp. Root60]